MPADLTEFALPQDAAEPAAAEGRGRPRYLEIKAALIADIGAGAYPVGSRLPTEHELCQRFDVSRFTVRQALKGLQDAGMIERRPGVGSMVVADIPREAFVQSLTSLTELLRYPSETLRIDISRKVIRASPEQAHLLLCSPGEEWVRLQGVRIARGSKVPFSWSDIFVRPRFASVFDLPNPKGEPVYRQIEHYFNHKIGHARVEIFAGQIAEELSEPMQIETGTPALNMIRRYTGDDGIIFLVTYTVHPANRFVFTMDLERRLELA